jgi:1-acyl-sn-glycerol-3-phosphate acyltransferase
MKLTERIANAVIRRLTRILCRVDAAQLARVPEHGPLMLVANHVNFLEAPIVVTHLKPRSFTGFVKSETWDTPFLGWLFDLWGAIPVRRGEADLTAMRRGIEVLEEGHILGVTPEGTRSGDGRLRRGHPGTVMVALKTGAPLLPLIYYGGERFWQNFKSLRRTDFHIVVGNPFTLHTEETRVTREVRRQMIDEIMYQLAALLPPEYRGAYADLESATETYLRFPPGSHSNIHAAVSPSSDREPEIDRTAKPSSARRIWDLWIRLRGAILARLVGNQG